MFKVDLSEDIIEQLSINLDSTTTDKGLMLNSSLGSGIIERISMNNLELLYYKYQLVKPYSQYTFNPIKSEYYVLMINMSKKAISKLINGETVSIHKYQPVGLIVYPPGTSIQSYSKPGEPYEMIVIKFSREFLNEYFDNDKSLLEKLKTVIYEDVTLESEKILMSIINNRLNKIKAHSLILNFIGDLLSSFSERKESAAIENVHPDDIKGLFAASNVLRNPIIEQMPTIQDLASLAEMGSTKFKQLFKQVFGYAPKQYHMKVKMDYAREQITVGNRLASELSYELGYSHPSKFTKAYKSHFGTLPSLEKQLSSDKVN
jgi:AraC-like DNA-binding protein